MQIDLTFSFDFPLTRACVPNCSFCERFGSKGLFDFTINPQIPNWTNTDINSKPLSSTSSRHFKGNSKKNNNEGHVYWL